jgi:Fic family protein
VNRAGRSHIDQELRDRVLGHAGHANGCADAIALDQPRPVIFETPPLSFEEDAALARIDDLWRQLRFYVAEPRRWVGSVRRVLGARAIQGSNSIEGFNVSVEDALAAMEGDEPAEAEFEDWTAIVGYRRALTYVLQLAHDPNFRYTPEVIKSLHFMMTEYGLDAGPGLWRSGPIWVRNDATGDIVYEGPDYELIPSLVNELVDELSADGQTPPLVRAAMAHLNLVMIHPFRDGNGRMSRCLQTLVLAREQILPKDFSSIEEYLGTNTDSYYRILAEVGRGSWNPSNNALPWVRYCLEAHFIQAASVLRRVRESEQMWREIEVLREQHRLPDRAMAALFDASIRLRVRNSSYRASMDEWGESVSTQVATDDLRAMVNAGLLVKRGAKRGTYYEAAEPLREIRERVRADRKPLTPESLFDLAA